MIDPERICLVTNRSSGTAGYALPERHIRRIFQAGETKRIPYYEIEELSSQPGGKELIYHYLYIQDEEVLKEGLNINPEPEYYLINTSNVDNWMTTCSLAEFQDALDFAPEGIKDLIKIHAVKLPLNDMQKAQAIKDQLHYDVVRAIENERAVTEEEPVKPTGRRAAVEEKKPEAPKRRTNSKYKVVGRDVEEV